MAEILDPTATTFLPTTTTMPIAPITGKLRKRLWLDLTTAAGLGTVFAYGYWFVLSLIELNGLLSFCSAHFHEAAYHSLQVLPLYPIW